MKFTGTVIQGHQVGARFGIATANLEVTEELSIKEGVYLVQALILKETINSAPPSLCSSAPISGLLHIGPRKTFGSDFSIEVHLLDFDGDLYSKTLSVEVLKFLRPIQKFENADALFTHIEKDIVQAEKFFMRRSVKEEWENFSEAVGGKQASQRYAGQEKEKMEQAAVDQVSDLDVFQKAEIVLAYAPQPGREIEFVEPLMKLFPGKDWYFPRVNGDQMSFYKVEDWDDLEAGNYGIREPGTKGEKLVCSTKRSFTGVQDDNILVLVPAVAADEEGNRLGRGRGYYDQFLNSESSPCEGGVRGGFTTLSVMPNFAVVENIPVEEHDQALDEVISIEA